MLTVLECILAHNGAHWTVPEWIWLSKVNTQECQVVSDCNDPSKLKECSFKEVVVESSQVWCTIKVAALMPDSFAEL